jgi:hypothetical protein
MKGLAMLERSRTSEEAHCIDLTNRVVLGDGSIATGTPALKEEILPEVCSSAGASRD